MIAEQFPSGNSAGAPAGVNTGIGQLCESTTTTGYRRLNSFDAQPASPKVPPP
ncbi:MAG: hypothetical protein HC765_16035 [Brachymonas sp.]|nr:hypothetical protein [Brachymonas sp.]